METAGDPVAVEGAEVIDFGLHWFGFKVASRRITDNLLQLRQLVGGAAGGPPLGTVRRRREAALGFGLGFRISGLGVVHGYRT